jgi:hypothetical protein
MATKQTCKIILNNFGARLQLGNKVINSSLEHVLNKLGTVGWQETPMLPLNCRFYLHQGRTHIIALEFPPSVYDVIFEGDLIFSQLPKEGVKLFCSPGSTSPVYLNLLKRNYGIEIIPSITSPNSDNEDDNDDCGLPPDNLDTGEEGDEEEGDEEDEDEEEAPAIRLLRKLCIMGEAWFRIPVPRLLYCCVLGVGDKNFFRRDDFLLALSKPLASMEDVLYTCPFGNVSAPTHELCWDTAENPRSFSHPVALSSVLGAYFNSKFNSDLDMSTKWITPEGYSYWSADLFNFLQGKEKFPEEILVKSTSFQEFIRKLIDKYIIGG